MRVISLLPSATEIVCSLGCGETLVGRSHECDFPPIVRDLPSCTRTRIDAAAPSAAIDAQVKESLARAISLYEVDAGLLRQLRPDVLLTQDLCRVCAVDPTDVQRAIEGLLDYRPQVLSLQPMSLADVYGDIDRVSATLGVPDRGREMVAEMRSRIADVSARANGWGRRPTVACLEWLDPLMAAGNWIPELVELAGGCNLFGRAGEHSPWMTFDDLLREDPDVIVALPCGFDLPRTRREMAGLSSRPEWERLRAVRHGRVHLADGNAFFNRPGPRLVEAVEMLAEAIQPAAFRFDHDGMQVY